MRPSRPIKIGSARVRACSTHMAVLGAYFLLSVALTFPMILHMTEFYIFKDPGSFDMPIFLWEFWWFKKAIVDLGHQPFFSEYIFHPVGADLTFQSHAPIYSLLSVPLQLLFGERGIFLSYNLFVLVSFTFCGWGTYLLAHHFLKHRSASFLSGILFAFCGVRLLNFSRFHVLSMEFMPFFLLYLIKMIDEKGKKNACAAALFLVMCFYNTFTNFLNAVLVAGCFLLVRWIQEGNALFTRDRLMRFFLASALFVILSAPLLYLIFQNLLTGNPSLYRGLEETREFSLDLARLFVPTGFDSLYGSFFTEIPLGPYEQPFSYFLGFVQIYLILIALTRSDARQTLPWWFSAAALFVLSLGPYLNVLGLSTGIPLPFLFLYKYVPIFQICGVPFRIVTGVYLSLAILAAYGTAVLFREAELYGDRKPQKLFERVRFLLMSLALAPLIMAGFSNPSRIYRWFWPDGSQFLLTVRELHFLHIALSFVGSVVFLLAFLSEKYPVFKAALRPKTLIVAALGIFIWIESIDTFPVLRESEFKALPFHRQLAKDGERYTILDVPNVGFSDRFFMLYQIYHGKRIVFACFRRGDPRITDLLDDIPLVRDMGPRQDITTFQALDPPSPEEVAINRDKMKRYGIKYVIVHGMFRGLGRKHRKGIEEYKRCVEQYQPIKEIPFKRNIAYQFW